jgi:hypothetical protein
LRPRHVDVEHDERAVGDDDCMMLELPAAEQTGRAVKRP